MKYLARSIPHSISIVMLLAAMASLSAQPTPAPTKPAADADVLKLSIFEVRGEESNGYSSASSVSATRTKTNTLELPFSLSVTTSEQINDIAAQDFDEALVYTATAPQTSPGELQDGRLNIRGFTANEIKRNGFVLRAQGINNAAYVDRVELVRGPSTVLYGIGRPGGSINVITKAPQSKRSLSLKTTFGSYGRQEYLVDMGGALIPGKLDSRLVLQLGEQDGFSKNVFNDRKFIGSGLRWRIDERTTLSMDAVYSTYQSRRAFRMPTTREATGIRTVLPGLPDDFTVYPTGGWVSKYAEYSGWLTLVHEFDSGWNFRAALEGVDMDQDRWERSLNSSSAVNANGTTVNLADSRTKFFDRSITSQNDLTKSFKGNSWRDEFLIGAGWEFNKFARLRWQQTTNNYPVFDTAAQAAFGAEPATWRDLAALFEDRDRLTQAYSTYVINQLSVLGDKLKFMTGGRYEHNHETRTRRVGPTANSDLNFIFKDYQLGVTYLPRPNLAVYSSISTSSKNNPSFPSDPERGKGLEAGIKFSILGKKLTGTISYFDISLTNIQKTVGAFDFLAGKEQSHGVDLDLYYRHNDRWQTTFGIGHNTTKVVNDTTVINMGQPTAGTPENILSLWSRYNITKSFGVGAGVKYASKTRIANLLAYDPQTTTFDVAAYYSPKWAGHDWRFQFNAINVTDEFLGDSGVFYKPRDYRVSAMFKF